MQIENEFEVKAPIQNVWAYLLDVERVAPCMPGAELTEVVDADTYKGKTNVKLGPVSLSFAGTVVMQERDESAHRVVMKAEGREQRGKGAASAVVTSTLSSVDGGTKVGVVADLTITGAVAQYGRGLIQDISQRLAQQFAECLESNIEAEAAAAAAPEGGGASPAARPAAAAAPVKGVRLGLWAFWQAIARFFRRLFGSRPTSGAA
ncbi:MAG TPA: SRPBCC family protein [Actinomycetota bacterium]|jgi:hypothetical protein